MRQELKAMHDLLLEQKSVQRQLLELSYEKNQVIIRGDTERLSEITGLEQRGVVKLRNLSKKHAKLLPALAGLLEIPENEINLSRILEKATAQEYEAFFLLQRELSGLYSSQLEINKLNAELLETHLEYTDNMLGALVGDEDPLNNFYGVDGRADSERKKSTGFFDRQI